jgi:hypothetical protein
MKNKKKHPKHEPLTENHSFSLSYDDSCNLIERAAEANLSVAAYCRQMLGFKAVTSLKKRNSKRK